jgi:serine/threonine-protein kinase
MLVSYSPGSCSDDVLRRRSSHTADEWQARRLSLHIDWMLNADRLTAALAGRYTIVRQLGQGGMATVYLAHDVRHERHVALKLLRPELAAVVGADRFLKEVKTTAHLQHPHILPLHDSGEAADSVYYVMPFVEGESLRDRLLREKLLPIDDAVRIAREVLSALDYAHRHGVVHRDIKPENILLHDGQALVADFGIALAMSSASDDTRLTETGMSLGTPHYMSPEQAMGERDISGRSDVYAMGCVLYEMLLGEPPFTGPTAQSIIARVITEEPRRMVPQRKTIPPHVEAAALKALAKLPADRFASAAEFAGALGRSDSSGVERAAASERAAHTHAALWRQPVLVASIAVAAVSVGVAAFTLSRARADTGAPEVRFDVPQATDARMVDAYEPLAISPDGRTIAIALQRGGSSLVQVRPLGDVRMRGIAGTEGATNIAFSADGNWIAFTRGTSLFKVPLGGGQPTKVADVPWSEATASWAADGSVLVGSRTGGSLYRLPSENAAIEELTRPDQARGELGHRLPQALPDPAFALFVVEREDGGHPAVLSLASRTWIDLGLGVAGTPAYAGGHLVYPQANRVMAVPFDVRRGRVTGAPTVVDSVPSTGTDRAEIWKVAAAPTGTIVYAIGAGGENESDLLWADRTERVTHVDVPSAVYDMLRLSPRADAVVANTADDALDLVQLASGRRTRVARPPAQLPEWSADGRYIAYSDARAGLWIATADGSAEPRRIVESRLWPYSWGPNGDVIAAYAANEATGRDIVIVRRGDDGTWSASPFLATPYNERSPAISPDGRWLAYTSDESGVDEIYVRPFPTGEGKWLVSRGGGREPAWSGTARELFYRRGREIFAVSIAAAQFDAGEPTRLFTVEATMSEGPTGERDWDVTRDGRRFMFMRSRRATSPFALRVVVNFRAATGAR